MQGLNGSGRDELKLGFPDDFGNPSKITRQR